MNLTPEEAMGKFCPMGYANPNDIGQACIGPSCMAWRWVFDQEHFLTALANGDATEENYTSTHGYCGMAGKP